MAFHAGGYFRTDRQALLCGYFLVSLSSSIQICFGLGDGQDTEGFLNIVMSLGCCHYFYTKVCSRRTSGGDLRHARTSKLISAANR